MLTGLKSIMFFDYLSSYSIILASIDYFIR